MDLLFAGASDDQLIVKHRLQLDLVLHRLPPSRAYVLPEPPLKGGEEGFDQPSSAVSDLFLPFLLPVPHYLALFPNTVGI